jgi:hypothetical protein
MLTAFNDAMGIIAQPRLFKSDETNFYFVRQEAVNFFLIKMEQEKVRE